MTDRTPPPQVLLASKSPRRLALLRQLDLRVATVAVDVAEVVAAGESPGNYNCRVAGDKARAGFEVAGAGLPVLGADTEVVLEGRVFGKPDNPADAAAMLRALSNRTHQVITAVAVVRPDGQLRTVRHCAEVTFARLDDDQIAAYCQTQEPMGKAGGYAIQGLAAVFVRHLSGSYSGVMGLPLHETAGLLRWAGLRCPVLGGAMADERAPGPIPTAAKRC